MPTPVHIVLDAQYGSVGKGAYAAWLARSKATRPILAFRTGGPNAGHSIHVESRDGATRKVIALRHIPAAAVQRDTLLALPGAALIHIPTLLDEIEQLEALGYQVRSRLTIDPLATVIEHDHEKAEQSMREAIGSTREGVGAAQASKIARGAGYAPPVVLARDRRELDPFIGDVRSLVHSTVLAGDRGLLQGKSVHIEMTQGVGLGLHFGHYPFATSRDITPGQALSDCYLSPTNRAASYVVHLLARSYPIRVAGNSGPFGVPRPRFPVEHRTDNGEREITWDDLYERTGGYVDRAERTTVTKLERRIAEWDGEVVARSVQLTAPQVGVLMFADYVWSGLLAATLEHHGFSVEATRSVEWRWPTPVLQDLQLVTSKLWQSGAFDQYREPFLANGSDLGYVSWGFGAIVPTPVAGSLL